MSAARIGRLAHLVVAGLTAVVVLVGCEDFRHEGVAEIAA